MDFTLPKYNHPDFSVEPLASAPNVTTKAVVKEGIAPERFHATSIFPEYFRVNGSWVLAEDSRMGACVVLKENNRIEVVEFWNLKLGDQVVLGRTADGTDGIYVNHEAFQPQYEPGDNFLFRMDRNRETAFSQDYDTLYNLFMYEREHHGNIVWVMGPACAFDADARASISYLIENGFVQGILAGNALAVHDLEAALFGTALGKNIYTQKHHHNGYYNHLDIMNFVRRAGSIEGFVNLYNIESGIVASCVNARVPMVLTGSIRDDAQLPGLYTDVFQGQDEMRNLLRKATTVVCLATQLHTIAACSMAPCYRVVNGEVRPLFIYSVDVSEFAINKLVDRGSLTATGIVTNVQDFVTMLAKGVQRKIEQSQ